PVSRCLYRCAVVSIEALTPCIHLLLVWVAALALVLVSADLVPAWAQEAEDPGVTDLDTVITNIRSWLMGLLVVLATLLLTVGGLRYLLAGGDPGEVNKAKVTLKYAALGYLVAILAPLLVEILRGFVGLE